MSRLDSAIRRLQAQRICLNWAVDQIDGEEGIILELGLGNGRSYDHLRKALPGRRIYVFDRNISPHPDCIPPDEDMYLGEMDEMLKAAARISARLPYWRMQISGMGILKIRKERRTDRTAHHAVASPRRYRHFGQSIDVS